MKPVLLFLLFGVAVLACKQDLNSAEQNLYDEVMKIHDVVMPKTKDIYRKQKALKKIQEGLEKAEDQIAVRKAVAALEEADEMMFNWMGAFKKRTDLPEGTDYGDYLSKEKVSIQAVSDAMLTSINEAEALIKKYANE